EIGAHRDEAAIGRGARRFGDEVCLARVAAEAQLLGQGDEAPREGGRGARLFRRLTIARAQEQVALRAPILRQRACARSIAVTWQTRAIAMSDQPWVGVRLARRE